MGHVCVASAIVAREWGSCGLQWVQSSQLDEGVSSLEVGVMQVVLAVAEIFSACGMVTGRFSWSVCWV